MATQAKHIDRVNPATPTGQYPNPVWANGHGGPLAAAAGAQNDKSQPPSPTGQYPHPVWANGQGNSTANGAPNSASSPGGTPGPAALSMPAVELDNQEMYQIIRAVSAGISGDSLYEYTDATTAETDGLRFGLAGFRQANGELGELLSVMNRRDPSLFSVIMGPDSASLLQTTATATRAERLQPVGGHPLWHPSWMEKFQQAGRQPTFQAAQNEVAIEFQFLPLLDAAREMRLSTDRGLALLYDRALAEGAQKGIEWLRGSLPPANGIPEAERLQTMIRNTHAPLQSRLHNIFSSNLLDGTTYNI